MRESICVALFSACTLPRHSVCVADSRFLQFAISSSGRIMKTAALFFGGLVTSVFLSGPVAAEPVRVRLTARVSEVTDPSNLLAGKIVVGQRVNGTYVYNTNTPDQETFPLSGRYIPYANEARMRFVVGTHVFENNQPTQAILIEIHVQDLDPTFRMASSDNKPLANGVFVDTIRVQFDGRGNLTETDALVPAAPVLEDYSSEITLSGSSSNDSFEVRAEIEVAELIVPDQVDVSPAAGSFVPNQHFDASWLLPRNTAIASMSATVNGATVPLSYPGTCTVDAPNSAHRVALVCAGADAVLAQANGEPIEWTIELTNGAIHTGSVSWVLVE